VGRDWELHEIEDLLRELARERRDDGDDDDDAPARRHERRPQLRPRHLRVV
jgi:hypothetical protein